MKQELAKFIHETYLSYLKSDNTNGIPFQDYLAEAIIKVYKISKASNPD